MDTTELSNQITALLATLRERPSRAHADAAITVLRAGAAAMNAFTTRTIAAIEDLIRESEASRCPA